MNMHRSMIVTWGLMMLLTTATATRAASVWSGGSGDWHDGDNWTPPGVPGNGVAVTIGAGADILLNAPTADLGSLAMTGGTLIFTNWTTSLSATNITISAGTVSLPSPFSDTDMSNRVWFVCSNLFLGANASITADGKGYQGGDNAGGAASGPGAGANDASYPGGGGYGGAGGGGGGSTYGSISAPLAPGSGGGGRSTGAGPGGHGGGAVFIDAAGMVTVNGTISANGTAGTGRGGDASGGGILIDCRTFAGTNGLIRANAISVSAAGEGGGGGGGRIAVSYDAMAQNQAPSHSVRFSTHRSHAHGGGTPGQPGLPGTLFFSDDTMMRKALVIAMVGELHVPDFTAWSADNLVIANSWLLIGNSAEPFTLTVTNNLVIRDGAATTNNLLTGYISLGGLELANGTIWCGGDLVITNTAALSLGTPSALTNLQELICGGDLIIAGGQLFVYAAATNGPSPGYGARVEVTGNVALLGSNSWIYPYTYATNGGSVRFAMTDLTIDAGCGINADSKGWRGAGPSTEGMTLNGYGPGKGLTGSGEVASGGGYGGQGGPGSSQPTVGATYGSTNAPLFPGSGGGCRNSVQANNRGGNGGGLVWIHASGDVTMDGTLTANGANGSQGAGGAGGGIWITGQSFAGAAGAVLQANGGAGHTSPANYGGGGGGRIAIWYGEPYGDAIPPHRLIISESAPSGYNGTAPSVAGGLGWNSITADSGTVRFIRVLAPAGSLFSIR